MSRISEGLSLQPRIVEVSSSFRDFSETKTLKENFRVKNQFSNFKKLLILSTSATRRKEAQNGSTTAAAASCLGLSQVMQPSYL